MPTLLPDSSTSGGDTLQNCPDRIRVYHRDTGRRLLLPCRRRVCSYCGPKHWRPKVLAGLHSGLGRDGHDYLAILLTAPGGVDADTFNADVSAKWNRFTTYLRRAWGRTYPDLQFWRVAELQARGHVHFHVVVRGARFLPVTNASGTGLRDLAVQAGFGTWVGVRRPRDYPGGVRSLGHYFGKYLLKGYSRSIGVSKLVTFSQGWRVGWVTRKREGESEWVYVGARRAPWLPAIGYVEHPDRTPPKRPGRPPDYPSWWREPWQWQHARFEKPIAMGLEG